VFAPPTAASESRSSELRPSGRFARSLDGREGSTLHCGQTGALSQSRSMHWQVFLQPVSTFTAPAGILRRNVEPILPVSLAPPYRSEYSERDPRLFPAPRIPFPSKPRLQNRRLELTDILTTRFGPPSIPWTMSYSDGPTRAQTRRSKVGSKSPRTATICISLSSSSTRIRS
jgi:hypothetical protein